jgi:hypothetical protein
MLCFLAFTILIYQSIQLTIEIENIVFLLYGSKVKYYFYTNFLTFIHIAIWVLCTDFIFAHLKGKKPNLTRRIFWVLFFERIFGSKIVKKEVIKSEKDPVKPNLELKELVNENNSKLEEKIELNKPEVTRRRTYTLLDCIMH